MQESGNIRLEPEGRFDRFQRIAWWNQENLRKARLLVIGAGALGNEILKNLALLGAGNIFVADLDRVEESNLSRSVLYRERDRGQPKAKVAAQAVKDIYPEIKVQAFHGDVIYELGMGVYRWADVVIAGVDNREARLHINRCCWKTNTPFIDGATEILQGIIRVFAPPAGPCYECTMSEGDWHALQERRGCAGLRAEHPPEGVVPTTPTTAAIIAALQCQEALKLLHGLDGLAGKGLVFNSIINDAYVVAYPLLEDCNSHESFDEVIRLDGSTRSLTAREVLEQAVARLGQGAVLEFNHELLLSFYCPACQQSQEVFRSLGSVPESEARCPRCQRERQADSIRMVSGPEPFLDRPLAELGVPSFDLITARRGLSAIAFEFGGDAAMVLGQLDQAILP
jgi:molybdopterin/thiamine biosynthesis adenylyltransferase